MTEISADGATARLSADRRTLVITRRVTAGVLTETLESQRPAGFTDEDVTRALALTPATSKTMQSGQRNITRRAVTRFGTVWTHLMFGPPTWRVPKLRREKDGTLMIGWLRAAVAVKFERAGVKDGAEEKGDGDGG
jgi:hypothetical protein